MKPEDRAGAYSSPSRSKTFNESTYERKRYSPMKGDDEEELVRAFKEQIRLEQELEDARVRLTQEPDFNLMDAFQTLDRTGKGYVSAPEIADALSDLGAYAHRDDVYLFCRRWDRN
jgi:hypothetical protein